MAQQKFFSGLTEGMINRASGERPDRQKTHFYWPDEYAPEPEPAPAINNRPINNNGTHLPTTDAERHRRQSHAGWEPVVVVRERHPKHAESHIQFYDGVGSSFGELERTKEHERARIAQFLRQQSEEETGEAARAKRLSTLQSKIEFYDYCTPPPPTTANGQRQRDEHDLHQTDEDELDFDDRSSYRSSVCSSTNTPTPSSGHRAHSSEHLLPEHKRNSQRHLRSSINFHNGCAIADESDGGRKPVSVRESATTRVGVGLPNL